MGRHRARTARQPASCWPRRHGRNCTGSPLCTASVSERTLPPGPASVGWVRSLTLAVQRGIVASRPFQDLSSGLGLAGQSECLVEGDDVLVELVLEAGQGALQLEQPI